MYLDFSKYPIRSFFLSQIIIILLLGVVILFTMKIIAVFEEKRNKKRCKLRLWITKELSEENLNIKPPKLPFKELLALLFKMDTILKGNEWKRIKERLLQEEVNKKIMKLLDSRRWINRYYALMACLLIDRSVPTRNIKKLFFDRSSIVRHKVYELIIKTKDKSSFGFLIEQFSMQHSHHRIMIRDLLLKADQEIILWIYELFKEEKNIHRRLACLEILSQKCGYLKIEDIEKDIRSDFLQIRWWCVRALENIPSAKALPYIFQSMKDPISEIRALSAIIATIHPFNDVKNALIGMLQDPNREVCLNAALALNSYQDEGKKVLKAALKSIKRGEELLQMVENGMFFPASKMVRWLDSKAVE